MTVYIGGNSHVGALQRGARELGMKPAECTILPFGTGALERTHFSEIKDGRVVFRNAKYRENLEKFTGKSYFDPKDIWGICAGSHSARLYRSPFWANAAPASIATANQRPVSRSSLDLMIRDDQKFVRTLLQQLQKTGVDCFVISCPPPVHEGPGGKNGVTPKVIQSIHRRYLELFRAWLRNNQIAFVPYPESALTPDGFLKEELRPTLQSGEIDPHHANGEYGKMMMREVSALLASKGVGVVELSAHAAE